MIVTRIECDECGYDGGTGAGWLVGCAVGTLVHILPIEEATNFDRHTDVHLCGADCTMKWVGKKIQVLLTKNNAKEKQPNDTSPINGDSNFLRPSASDIVWRREGWKESSSRDSAEADPLPRLRQEEAGISGNQGRVRLDVSGRAVPEAADGVPGPTFHANKARAGKDDQGSRAGVDGRPETEDYCF